jgi:altronate dehydratase
MPKRTTKKQNKTHRLQMAEKRRKEKEIKQSTIKEHVLEVMFSTRLEILIDSLILFIETGTSRTDSKIQLPPFFSSISF